MLTAAGRPTRNGEELVQAIQQAGIGGNLMLGVLRDGQRQGILVTPRARDNIASAEALARHTGMRAGEELRLGDEDAAAGQRQSAVAHYTRALQFFSQKFLHEDADTTINNILLKLAEARQGVPLAVPREADRHNRRAIALLQDARTPEDNDRAFTSFDSALYEAPWIADLWLNAGLVQEKAGHPDRARLYLRRALLLRPGANDEAAIRQKIASLEVLIEDLRPWWKFAHSWNYDDGHKEEIVIRGRDFVLRAASPPAANSSRRDRTGDVIARGTIGRGRSFSGKWVFRPANDDERRCFGAEYEVDAEFSIEPDGRLFITVLNSSYLIQSCEITKRERTVMRRYGMAVGS